VAGCRGFWVFHGISVAFINKKKYNQNCQEGVHTGNSDFLPYRKFLEKTGGKKLKLTINQDLNIVETEIIMNCAYLDERLNRLANYIRQYTFSLEGTIEDKMYQIPIEDIYYMESVDGRTFFYDSKNAYCSRQTITALEEKLKTTSFARISKSCLINTARIKCFAPYVNHRLKVELKNGENLIVSRNYIDSLKEKLRK